MTLLGISPFVPHVASGIALPPNTHFADFNGSSHRAGAGPGKLTNNASITAFSVAGWFQTNQNNRTILGEWDTTSSGKSWRVYIASNAVNFNISNGGSSQKVIEGTTDVTQATPTWFHFAVTYDGAADSGNGVVALYINNSAQGSVVTNNSLGSFDSTDSNVEWWIGSDPNGPSYFDGPIYDLRIAYRVWSSGERSGMYNGGTPDLTAGGPTDCDWWFALSDNDATVAKDYGTVGADATFSNTTGLWVAQ